VIRRYCDGTKVFVVNFGSNNVSVIDTSNNTVTDTINVGIYPAACGQFIGEIREAVLPDANFSANVTIGIAPLTVLFNDSSENATGWYWDFGDGNNSTEQNPVHTYFVAGNYTVNLTVSNDNGTGLTNATLTITVLEPVLPVANLSSNVTRGYAPLTVQFNDGSTNATTVTWDFGDGNNSTEQNPIHTYSAAGNYAVNLTVSNANGTKSAVGTIKVYNTPVKYYSFVARLGYFGTDNGQFSSPCGVAVDSEDNVYVADQSNNRIQKFNSTGAFITKWGSSGSGDGQFQQ
jgi:YVTN family beta-propeller protein